MVLGGAHANKCEAIGKAPGCRGSLVAIRNRSVQRPARSSRWREWFAMRRSSANPILTPSGGAAVCCETHSLFRHCRAPSHTSPSTPAATLATRVVCVGRLP